MREIIAVRPEKEYRILGNVISKKADSASLSIPKRYRPQKPLEAVTCEINGIPMTLNHVKQGQFTIPSFFNRMFEVDKDETADVRIIAFHVRAERDTE